MPPARDLSNHVFDRLTVVWKSTEKKGTKNTIGWDCWCECGTWVPCVIVNNLTRKHTKSCGCKKREKGPPCLICGEPNFGNGLCRRHHCLWTDHKRPPLIQWAQKIEKNPRCRFCGKDFKGRLFRVCKQPRCRKQAKRMKDINRRARKAEISFLNLRAILIERCKQQ